jgi:predicted nucleic acid-binding protein
MSSASPDSAKAPPLLIDTNVLSYLTASHNPHPEWDDLVRGRILVLSFVTVGEILHGTMTGGWSRARIAAVETRLKSYPVIPGTIGVARKFAELRRWFYKQIEDNDLWIAACALAQPEQLPLATADAHFDLIGAKFPLEIVRPR